MFHTIIVYIILFLLRYSNLEQLEQLNDLHWIPYLVSAINISLDVMFTVSLLVLLHLERGAFGKTNSMVNKLITICINTGLITTVAYILAIILLAALPSTNLAYVFPDYIVVPLYCNSVLANLNSRKYIRGDNVIVDTKLETIKFHAEKSVSETCNSGNSRSTGCDQRDISFNDIDARSLPGETSSGRTRTPENVA